MADARRAGGPPAAAFAGADVRSWAIALVAGFAAYACVSQGLLYFAGAVQIPLLVGVVVGLIALAPAQAAVAAAIALAVSMLVWPPLLAGVPRQGALEWALALLAPAAAFGVSWARAQLTGDVRTRVTAGVAALVIAWALMGFWTPLFAGGWPPTGYGLLSAAQVRAEAVPGHYGDDEGLYRRIYALLHAGESPQQAFRDAWLGIDTKPALPGSPFGYRLPTYFWLERALPSDPFSLVWAFLAFASMGLVASALIAWPIVGPRLAPLAALAFAAYALDVGFSSYALFLDLPAMCIALAGVACFVWALARDAKAALWAAVALLTLAALTREILVYLLVFAALSAIAEQPGARLRAAVPWLAGLGLFAAGYAAHAASVWPLLGSGASVGYLNGGAAYFADAFSRFTGSFAAGEVDLVALVLLGVAGGVAAGRRLGSRFSAFAVPSVVVPLAAMLVIGNPGHEASGAVANYWGLLVIPLALALWPASALLVAPRSAKAASSR